MRRLYYYHLLYSPKDEINWDMVPDDWTFCFRDECPLHKECLRWHTGQIIPDEIYSASCVFPFSPIGYECFLYVSMEKILAAHGFTIYYDCMRLEDQPVIRKIMEELLSRQYYNEYKCGMLLILPELQDSIKEVFEKYGYQDCIRFNDFVKVFNFEY